MRRIPSAALAGALLVPAASTAVGAATASNGGVLATYDGRQINLADGWQGAHACVVLTRDDVRCYDSASDVPNTLVAAAQSRPAADGIVAAAACTGSGFVTLYADTGMGGDSLSFASTSGVWTNLGPFGFDNDMESWTNSTGCNATAADGNNGAGDRLSLPAHSSSSNVGVSWKNRASSVNAP
jgi:hypothetical protein